MKLLPSLLLLTTALAVLPGTSQCLLNFPVKIGFCKQPKVTPYFDTERYFNNKWYIWKSIGSFFGLGGSCSGLDTKVTGNDVQLLNFQYEPILQGFIKMRGYANTTYIKMMGLPFPVDFELLGHFNYTTAFSVLGTDYDNWTAVYLCKQLVGLKIELSWVMLRDSQRTPTPEEKSQISEAISSIGYELDMYRTRDATYCGDGEPHIYTLENRNQN